MAIKIALVRLFALLFVSISLLSSIAPAYALDRANYNALYNGTDWYTGTLASQCAAIGVSVASGTAAVTPSTSAYGSASLTASIPTSVAAITKTSSTDTNASTVNARITYQYFIGKGLKPTAVGGILGNMSWESHFRADNASEMTWPLGGYGLSQWTNYQNGPTGRRTNLVKAMTTAGIGNLYNQAWDEGKHGLTPPDQAGILLGFELDYLWWELNGHYKSTLDAINSATSIADAVTKYFHLYEGINNNSLQKRIDAGNKYVTAFSGSAGFTGSTSASGCTTTASLGTPSTTPAGQFIYYNQNNPLWASVAFNNSTIKISGCGATSYAMAVANIMGMPNVTPATIANWSQPFWSQFGYVGEVLASHGVSKYGLQQKQLGTSMSAILAALTAGQYVIIGGAGSAPYYPRSGHIVLAHGLTASGKIIVADPERGSADEYSPSAISSGMKYAVALYK